MQWHIDDDGKEGIASRNRRLWYDDTSLALVYNGYDKSLGRERQKGKDIMESWLEASR